MAPRLRRFFLWLSAKIPPTRPQRGHRSVTEGTSVASTPGWRKRSIGARAERKAPMAPGGRSLKKFGVRGRKNLQKSRRTLSEMTQNCTGDDAVLYSWEEFCVKMGRGKRWGKCREEVEKLYNMAVILFFFVGFLGWNVKIYKIKFVGWWKRATFVLLIYSTFASWMEGKLKGS